MSKLIWSAVKACPSLLGATLLVSSSTLAAQIVPEQMAAATDKTINSPQSIDQSTLLEGKKAETNSANSTFPSNAPVIANNTVAEPASVAQATPTTESATPASVNLEQIQNYSSDNNTITSDDPMGQITNVSQFRDVQPSDWAYEALSRVVEKYGCLQGYPDGTFRGNRALSRYEFAAGLNACLRQIEALIQNNQGGTGGVSQTDFEALQRLSEEFRTELATLGTRVDNLEGRTAFIEQRQFSTTTKLTGEVIAAISDVFGSETIGENVVPGGGRNTTGDNASTILSDRVRLNFDTSFTGKDRLRTRLQARNTTPFNSAVTGTNMTRLGFDGAGPGATATDNDLEIHRLEYRFPLTPKATVFLNATGTEYNDAFYTFNPFLESAASGSVSRFGRFNPIYRQSREGAAALVDYKFSKAVGLSLGYAVPRNRANDPTQGRGIFSGSYTALAQLAFRPSDAFNLGLTYVHSYDRPEDVALAAGTGSSFANQPFGALLTSADHFGLEASLRFNPRIALSGWVGYTTATAEADAKGIRAGDDADILNYAVTLAFPDLGKKGNLLGFVFGMPPKVTDGTLNGSLRNGLALPNRQDKDTSYHIEGFYRYRLSDNIDITPGAFVILNPQHNNNNADLFVGTLRTTFRF